MIIATIRRESETTAVRVEKDSGEVVLLPFSDVGVLLQQSDWRSVAAMDGARVSMADVSYAPLVPRPDKIVCVGLNYRSHVLEMGRELPDYPTIFAKYRSSLIGAFDDIVLPAVSDAVDWEAELAIVIGKPLRHGSANEAEEAIAGYSILNDVTARDWQRRTLQFLQGKTFEQSTPFGPWLVTPDEPGAIPSAVQAIRCTVNGEVMQESATSDLIFDCVHLVSYLSTIFTLLPGDVIATGTPGGVGAGMNPPRFLRDGDEVVTQISGLGEARSRCVREVLTHSG